MLVLLFDSAQLGGVPVERIRAALSAEGLPAGSTYGPVYTHTLWNVPEDQYRMVEGGCPVTDAACADRAVCVKQTWLLTDVPVVDAMANAIRKVATACVEGRMPEGDDT